MTAVHVDVGIIAITADVECGWIWVVLAISRLAAMVIVIACLRSRERTGVIPSHWIEVAGHDSPLSANTFGELSGQELFRRL